jgi:hypothetical protein
MRKPGPSCLEILMPGHERLIVICAKIMQIFHDEMLVNGVSDLPEGRLIAVRDRSELRLLAVRAAVSGD